MLAGWRVRHEGAVESVQAFMYASQQFTPELVVAAARRFADGAVPGQNTEFPPSVATFAAELRRTQESPAAKAKERAEDTRRMLDKMGDRPRRTPEELARVQAKVAEFKRTQEHEDAKAARFREQGKKAEKAMRELMATANGQVSLDGTGEHLIASLENLRQEREARELVEAADKIRMKNQQEREDLDD